MSLVTYQINNTVYSGAYYLADGIYPRWTTFVKTIPNPQSEKERSFASFQEGYRKDVERCFGILQARWAIIRGAARMLDEEVLRSIMMTCIILHNMIVEDEYDYDAPEVFEPDPMNTALTRIYERPMGPNGLPMEPEPLVRDGRFNNPMIDRYEEMQSSYVHERRQVDLIEHLKQYNKLKDNTTIQQYNIWQSEVFLAICSNNCIHSLFEVPPLLAFAAFLPIGLGGRGSGDSVSIGSPMANRLMVNRGAASHSTQPKDRWE
ncbi:Long-chain fatty alcohol dehydrogenase family protein [Prunus dulcis]|uniref:Long-chain fatty alcohol dehydrogenase family protein n=1 Tax=Prunus dulcis TaxID=3755 RepID=A0A4Y1RL66_PRUDU|nr:Long-chain fatty alcohol dehydrogenase family protein [Prunus dulcis]